MGIGGTHLSLYCLGGKAIIAQGYHFQQQDVIYALNTPFNPSFNKPFETIPSSWPPTLRCPNLLTLISRSNILRTPWSSLLQRRQQAPLYERKI